MRDRRNAKPFGLAAVVGIMVACVTWASVAGAGELTRWSFESGARTNDTASGGTADPLTEVGTVSYAAGVVGDAASLTNSPAYLSGGDSSDLDLGGPTWTMECFVKDPVASAAWKRLVWKWSPSTQIHWALRDNKFDLFANGGPGAGRVGPVLNDDQWHHIAMVNDSAGSFEAWVDGVRVYVRAGITIADTGSPFWLGNDTDAMRFKGLVDEFIIHDDTKDGVYLLERAALRSPGPNVIVDILVEQAMGWTGGGPWNNGYGGLVVPGVREGAEQMNLDRAAGGGSVTLTSPGFADTLKKGTYTVEFAIGKFSNFAGWNDPSALAVDFAGLTLGEASAGSTPLPPVGGWTNWSITWDVKAGDSRIGDPLSFSLTSTAQGPCFDGVGSLSANGNGFLVSYVPPPPPTGPLALLEVGVSNALVTASDAVVHADMLSPEGTVATAGVWVAWSDAGDQGTNSLADWGANAAYQGIAATGDQVNATFGGALSADTLYTFRLFATNSADNVYAWSAPATFVSGLTSAQAPVFNSAVYSRGTISISLDWTNRASNLTGFVLQRATVDNPADYATVRALDAGAVSYSDPISVPGTYYYRLAATNTVNASGTGLGNAKTNVTVLAIDPLLTLHSFENSGNDTATGGGTADNLVGNGTITYAAGVVGQAVSLAGGYLSAADSDDLDLGTAAWTMECYIKDGLASAGWKRLVWKWAPSLQVHWALQNNKLDLHANNVSVVDQVGPLLNDGKWHHIAMVNDFNSDTLTAWVDGKRVYSGAAIAVSDTASAFWLGHSESRFTGLVDEFIIHGEAKDAAYMWSRAVLSQDYTTDPMADPFIIDGSPAFGQTTHDVGTWRSGHVFDGDSVTDYASASAGTNTFLTFDFGRTVTIGSFGHHNRAAGGETVSGSTLTFSRNATFGDGDDQVVDIEHTRQQSMAIYDMGSQISARYVRWQAAGSGVGVNRGAREIKFFATRYQTVTNPTITQVSSEWNTMGPYAPDTGPDPAFHASNVFDDRDDGHADAGEAWTCFQEGATPWLDFDFGEPTLISGVSFTDRQLAATYFLTSKLFFSQDAVFGNGDDVAVSLAHAMANGAGLNHSRSEFLSFEPQEARYVRWQGETNTGADLNSGITELSFVTTVPAGAEGTMLIVR